MIISTITQIGLHLYADPEQIPFQYSSNIQMQFIKDENYNDYTVVGYYIPPGQHEAKLLSINDDGTFTLGPDCFKNRGMLSFSFNLINSQEEVHLGSIDFEVRYSFGDGDTILPEPEEVWISLVTQVAEDAIKEDVELVKQKANEALQSASLANDKASEAKEYANNANQSAGSASLSASSALTAKNDAIAASNQALGFSNNASESAIEAKNSADEALENANASNKALETVNQIKTQIEDKANEFDTNYQEKLSLFNDNATEKQNAFNQSVTSANDLFDKKVVDANNDLDSKLQQANTTIDEKVTEATEQAQKAKDEADRAEQATAGKLDKNLGAESANKLLGTDEAGNIVVKEEIEQTASNVSYGDNSNVEVALDDINKKLGDLMYTPISIISFTNNKNTVEMGSTITDVTLNWNYNKTPKTLSLDGSTLDVSLKTKTLSGQSIKTNKTFTLKAIDERDAVATKTTAITFLNGVYYGIGDDLQISGITNQFILGLTKTLQSSKAKTFTVNAGAGKHIYYIIPSRYGTPVFKVGGFEGGFGKLGTVNFTNASGYAENYDVYKSGNANLGSTTVVVS